MAESATNDKANGVAKPNHGGSVQDIQAVGPESKPLADWQKSAGIDTSKQIKLVKVAHMRYQHPNLDEITTFLGDFGMHIAKKTDDRIWYRGYGPDQYVYYAQKGEKKFLGGTFEVESYEELAKASRLAGSSEIQELTDAPGGGHMVSLADPEGFPINLLYGQQPAEKGELPQKVIYNDETDKPRVRKFNRFSPGPAAVHKLGHYGMCCTSFPDQVRWYTSTFNLAPSDFLHVPSPDGQGTMDVAMFAHIDRGDVPVDHHSFFITLNSTSHVHHASFEVHDYDTQNLGHQHLAGKGYTSVWGVGRHILGSQIFDYWWDTTGNMIEHYADGDLVNKETPVGFGNAGDESLVVWGPEVPKLFLQ